jgi:hypothetical protein
MRDDSDFPFAGFVLTVCVSATLLLGCAAPQTDAQPIGERIVVLASERDPAELRALACPADKCLHLSLESFRCSRVSGPAEVVVLTGHSSPPEYVGHEPRQIAAAIQCLAPELLVLDTCDGFSAPLLDAIVASGASPLIVGATFRLPPAGLSYDPAFFANGPIAARADAVHARSGAALMRWRSNPRELANLHSDVARWTPSQLTANLKRVHPNLVLAPLSSDGTSVLVLVEPARFRR